MRRAEAGERTVVTVGGRPVAELGPLAVGAADFDSLIATGALVPPRRRGPWRPPVPVSLRAGTRLDRAVSEIRR